MNCKLSLGQRAGAVSVAVVILFTSALFAGELHAQSAQPIRGPVIKPAAPPTFLVAPSVSLGYAPTSVATGHLTSSGELDLVTADYKSGNISVFAGLGHGTFAAGVKYAAGAQPNSVAIADINGDGKADVILANASEGVISVFFGNGDGTLAPRKTYAVGFSPSFLVVGDFNGNGKLDLAVAGAAGKNLAILQNDGTGNLQRPQNFALAGTPAALVSSDFNHDGHLDLAIATTTGTVSILLGKGNGQFTSLPDISVAMGAFSSIAVGDFNRDGNDDLAVTSTTHNQVAVLLGQGDGSFAPAKPFAVGDAPVSTHVADVDGDGIPDLVVVNQGNNTFSVLSGVGDGSFKNALDFVVGNAPLGAVTGDYYGNGHVDIATIDQLSQTLTMPVAAGDGTFQAGRAYRAGVQPVAVASGDLTGSGKSDLAVANYCASDATCKGSGSAAILLAGAGGTYQLSSTYVMGAGSVSIALMDLNGDKKLDLVALNRVDKTVSVRLGAGDGIFGDLITVPLTGAPLALASGDFNRDGSIDLAVLTDCGSSKCSEPGQLEVFLGSGNGNFRSAANYGVGYSPVALAVGATFTGGNPDILVANRCGTDASCQLGGTASVLFGDGTGAFKPGTDVALGNSPSSIALANLRGAGVLDLVVARSADNAVAILPGTGKGTFKTAVPYLVGNSPGALAIADFDGDGVPDVAVANSADSTVSVLFGRGDGTVKPAFSVQVAGNPTALAAIGSTTTAGASLATANGSVTSTPAASNITVVANLQPIALAGTNAPTLSIAYATGSSSPSVVDQSVTFNATFTPTGANTPTAGFQVLANDGTTTSSLCTSVPPAVTLSCPVSSLAAGTYTISASYPGDNFYAAGSSATTLNHVVRALSSTITVTPLPTSSSPLNTVVTFTAALTGAIAPVAPHGAMTFLLNGSAATCVGSSTANSITVGPTTGAAACQIQNMPVSATNVVSATYSGDTSYTVASAGSSQNYTTTALHPTISFSATPPSPNSPSPLNTQVTFTASLGGVALAPVVPKGSMTFKLGANNATCDGVTNPVPVDATGAASCKISNMPAGSNTVSASYSLDNNYVVTASNPTATYVIDPLPATLSILANPPVSVAVGSPLSFTATISASSVSPISPVGSIGFTINGATSAACPPVTLTPTSQSATCAPPTGPTGNLQVQATYTSTDTNFNVTPTTVSATEKVTQATPSVKFLSPASNPTVNQSFTLQATVSAPGSGTIPPTGAVNFTQGPTTLCSAGLISTTNPSTASCSYSFASAGTQSVTATYVGDPNFIGPTSASGQAIVTAAATSLNIASMGSASIGTAVTYTTLLTAPNSGPSYTQGVPQGNVTFVTTPSTTLGGSCASGVAVQSGSVPSCTLIFSVGGSYVVTAAFTPTGGNFQPSTSNQVTQVVNAGSTKLALNSTPATSSVNQLVTFGASFSPAITGTPQPNGSVTYTDITVPTLPVVLCPAQTVTAGAIPQCAYSFTTALTHSVQASFTSSDSNFTSATSSAVMQTVNPSGTTAALIQTTASTVNQPVTFVATVTPKFPGAAIPTGNVTFSSTINGNSTTLCTTAQTVSPTGAGGTATTSCTAPFASPGTYSVTATYKSGDGNFVDSLQSAAISQMVSKTAISGTVSPTGNTVDVNGSVTFTVTVTSNVPGSTVPTGNVQFTDVLPGALQGQLVAQVCSPQALTTVGGVTTATCQITFLSAGVHTISASYPGDSNFSSGPAGSASTTVSATPTNLTLKSSNLASFANQTVTFTANVAPQKPYQISNLQTPMGTVTFTDTPPGLVTSTCANPANMTLIAAGDGSSTVACTVLFPHSANPVGQFSVTATYADSADKNFGTSTATIQTQKVQDFNSSYTITPGTGSVSSASGVFLTQGYATSGSGSDFFNPATITLNFTTSLGYSPTMSVACEVDITISKQLVPVTDPSCVSTPSVTTGNQTTQAYTIVASNNAPVGEYTVQFNISDTNYPANAQTPNFQLFVVSNSSPLSVAQGANGTESVTFNTVSGTSGAALTFSCGSIWDVNNKKFLDSSTASTVSCAGPAGTVIAVPSTTVAVTITAGKVVTAQLNRSSNIFYASTLFGVPLLLILGWVGRGKSPCKAFFRFLGLLLLLGGFTYATGCGGNGFKPPPPPSITGINPGTYVVQVVATDNGKPSKSYYADVPLTVVSVQ